MKKAFHFLRKAFWQELYIHNTHEKLKGENK